VAGGVLQIVGLLALLICACELLIGRPRRRQAAELEARYGQPTANETPCPIGEPELERLRQGGAL
jgi:hypothetical protein